MTQQIINLGSGPDTQTGDSLYTAFTKVNDNFTELYSVFDGNGISNINANVIISNNITVSSNIRTGNIAAYGNIETVGYVVTAGAFYPNGVAIGSLGSVSSNILPLTTNLYSIGSESFQFIEGYFSNNVTISGANVTVRDGLLYVNGQIASGNYGNSNVAAYLPVYGGNISATITTADQPYITQVGTLSNLTANAARIYGNLVIEGNLSVDGNVSFFNVDNLLVEDPIITLNTGANGSPLTFDNGFDSGVKTYYYDTQNREAFFGRKDSTGYFEYYSNVISDVGNIVSGTYGTIKAGNLILTQEASVTGNVSANYFLGNGRFLDGIDTTLISNGNSNVQVFQNGNIAISSGGVANVAQFTTIGGNLTGDFYITGTIKALNYIGNVQGNLSAPGANTQVIFNDNSTAGATAGFTFDKFTNSVVISGDLTAAGQAYLSNLTILGNTVYVQNSNDDIVLQPDGSANVYIGQLGQQNQLVVSGNINTPANIVVADSIVIDSNGNIVTSRLQDSGVTAGTYGNASAVPVITVDEKGRITVASTTAVAGVNNVTYDPVLSNLTIFTSAGTNYSVDLNVGTTDGPTFAGLTVAGNANISDVSISNSATIGTTLQAQGGIQNTIIGNIQPAQAFFTSESVTGNSTVNGLTVNTSVTVGLTLSASGGIQNTPIGNDTTSSGAFTAVTAFFIGNVGTNYLGNTYTALTGFNGNLNGALGLAGGNNAIISDLSVTGIATVGSLFSNSNITVNSRITSDSLYTSAINASNGANVNSLIVNTTGAFGDSLHVETYLVAGNVESNGYIRSNGNISSNGSISSIERMVAFGGLQNTPIGNLTPSTAQFTTVNASANTTVNALTVNNDATIGTNLSVGANTIVGNLRTAGTILITNTENSVGANTGALIVQGGASFEKDVHVIGNIYTTNLIAINANTLSVTDPLLYLTATNAYPYNFDIGFYSHFVGGPGNLYQHTGFVRDVDDGVWKLFSNVANEPSIVIDFTGATYDSLLTGTHTVLGQIIGNSSLSLYGNATVGNLISNANIIAQNLNVTGLEVVGNVSVGQLTVTNSAIITGTITAPGGLQNTPIGNAIPSSAQFTTVSSSGNTTLSELTVNGSSTIGTTLSVGANLIAANLITSSVFASNIISPEINLISQSIINAIGNLNPVTGNTYSLGNNTNYWSSLFANSLLIGNNITLGGNLSSGGNINGNGLSVVGSGIITSTLSVSGGIQNTVIGNVTPAEAYFTTTNTSGNATVNGLTVNNSATISSTLSVTGNITAPYLIGNIIGNISGNIAAPGSNRQVLFNDNNLVSGDSGLTFNKDTNELSVTGNLDVNWILAAGGAEFKLPVVVDAGLQNTAIGNVTPSFAIFTTESVSGNSTVNALTVNTSTTIGSSLQASGGIQATPIGNVTPSSAQLTILDVNTSTVTNSLTVNTNATIGTLLTALGGIHTTTVNANSNVTVNGLTVNTSGTFGSSLSASGGIQATPIGNVTPSSAQFTTVEASGNVTVDELTVNSSTTIGGTLDVNGAMLVEAIDVAGHANIGNLQISGNLTGNLIPTANAVYSIGSPNYRFKDLYIAGNTLYLGDVTLSSDENNFVIAGNIISANVFAPTIGNTGTDFVGETLSLTSNATVSGLTVNNSGTFGTVLYAAGGIQSTVIGNITPVNAYFTAINSSGNITANDITVNASLTTGTTVSAAGGIQNTPIGNTTPSTAQFTTVNTSGNITATAVTVNTSLTTGTTIRAAGGIQNTPIGNVTPNSAQFTTINASANTTVNALTVNASATIGSTLGVNGSLIVNGGIQNTPIGNSTPNTGQFTTLNTSGNITTANITVNSSITTGTSISAAGGLQNTPIGNAVPNSAQFTTVNASGATIVNSLSSNTSVQTASLNATANATVDALTVNNSTTIGGTLGITANITGTGLTLSGSQTVESTIQAAGGIQATPIGNSVPSTGRFSAITGDSLTITGNTVLGNLDVLGNITYINSLVTTLHDPIIELNTGPNGAPLVGSAPYDSGLKTHYWDGAADRSAFFGRSNSSGYFEYYSNVTSEVANVVTGVYGTIKTGNIILTGTGLIGSTLTVAANTTVNALTVNTSSVIGQTLQVQGGIQNTPIGNVTPSTALFTSVGSSGNITVAALTVNGSATFGTTLAVTGNVIAGNLTVNDTLITDGLTLTGGLQNTPIGNAVPSTGNFTSLNSTGNTTVNGFTVNTSAVIGSTLQVQSGIQNTPIGNVTPSTALFTTVGINSNATINALSVNNSATIGGTLGVTGNINAVSLTLTGSETVSGTIRASGGIQATPIGNATASTGKFTTLETTGTATVNSLISNGAVSGTTAQFTTINGSANATVNAITVNTSAIIGNSLQVAGGIQNTPIGNVTPNTAQFTTVNTSGNLTTSALTVNNSVTIGSTLGVSGAITVTDTSASTSNVTGAVKVAGGVGVAGNLYVGNRVGWVAANSVSAVYQVYNPVTNSLDTIFG